MVTQAPDPWLNLLKVTGALQRPGPSSLAWRIFLVGVFIAVLVTAWGLFPSWADALGLPAE